MNDSVHCTVEVTVPTFTGGSFSCVLDVLVDAPRAWDPTAFVADALRVALADVEWRPPART